MFHAHLLEKIQMQNMTAENDHIITEESLWEKYNNKEESLWKKQSVFKLPPHIASLNTNAFKPIVISFGPYHYNEPHLVPMEAHKLRSLERFLEITNTTLKHLLRSFKPMERELMDHYEQLGDKWRHGDCFLELMTRDGCFMLDILQSTTEFSSKYSINDPVFGRIPQSIAMCQNIKRDMLMIENQLPLLVLEKLIADNMVILDKLKAGNVEDWKKLSVGEITKEEFIHKQIHDLILKFLEAYNRIIQSHQDLCLHALDVVRKNMIIQRSLQRLVLTGVIPRAYVPPATALGNTGITFKIDDTLSLMDIRFQNGVLTLRPIFITKGAEVVFLNLMAFERFQTHRGQEVSAYIDFMGSLIHSAKDVNLLRSMKIIQSKESDEAIAELFYGFTNNQVVDPDDSLDSVRQFLNDHYSRHFWKGRCNERLAEWGSNFRQTYCKNPWTVMGLVAGIILLALTVMQTFYTVIPYYEKEPSSIRPPQKYNHH